VPRRRGAVVVSRPSRSGLPGWTPGPDWVGGVGGERQTARGCDGLGLGGYGQGRAPGRVRLVVGASVSVWDLGSRLAGRRWRGVLLPCHQCVTVSGRWGPSVSCGPQRGGDGQGNQHKLLDGWPVTWGTHGTGGVVLAAPRVGFGIRCAGDGFPWPIRFRVAGRRDRPDHQEATVFREHRHDGDAATRRLFSRYN
jgi:hypothetical protein